MQVDDADKGGDHGEDIDRSLAPDGFRTSGLERGMDVEADHQDEDDQRQRVNHIVPYRLDTGRV